MKKIIYGCYPSFFSLKIANDLIKSNVPLTHIMLSTRTIRIDGHEIKGFSGLCYLINRFGVRYTSFQLFCEIILPKIYHIRSCFTGESLLSYKQLCKKHGIELIETDSFNEYIKKIDSPDVFISMCLDQKLKDEFIKKIKTLCINVHPSDIPNFGGVEPIIQLKLSSEVHMGITIHKMTEEIDNGCPIMRKYISCQNKSYLRLMLDFIDNGIEMLATLYRNGWNFTECPKVEQKYPYRSWPTYWELKQFSASNSYIKLRDFI